MAVWCERSNLEGAPFDSYSYGTRGGRDAKKPPAKPDHTGGLAGGCAHAVAEDSGPSAAQLPLAGVPEKQGHLMLELEVTYQSPEKKEQQPRHHRGVLNSTKNGTVPAESATVVTAPTHAVSVSWPETLCRVGVPSV